MELNQGRGKERDPMGFWDNAPNVLTLCKQLERGSLFRDPIQSHWLDGEEEEIDATHVQIRFTFSGFVALL